METLTQRERDIVSFIQLQLETRGYPPSVREIAGAVSLNSSAAALNNLRRLEEKGILRRDPSKPRAIEIVGVSGAQAGLVKMTVEGTIEGGAVRPAPTGAREKTISMPRSIANAERGALFQIADDLCFTREVGAGDLAIVDFQGKDFKKNDLVLLKTGEEMCLGRLTQVKPSLRVMRSKDGARSLRVIKRKDICGKITAVIRQLV